MIKKTIKTVGCLATLISAQVQADIAINGFASIVAGKDTESKNFRNSPYSDELSFLPESKFALQVSADLLDDLTATAQVIARGSNDYDAEFEWAYLSYQLNENHTLRAGKLRVPFYKYSDYLDVGYAYPWIRPPRAMYNLTFSTYEGLSLLSNFSVGSWDFASNIIYGNIEDTFFETTVPTDGELNNIHGFNLQFSKDWFSGYVAYIASNISIPHPGIEGVANLVAAIDGPAAAETIRLDDDFGQFVGIGFTIDHNNVLFNAEASKVATDDALFLDYKQWYVSLGYRVNEFTPYISYQQTESQQNNKLAAGLSATPLPAAIHPAQPPLNVFVQGAFTSQWFEYTALTFGVRYDFHSNAALKIEYNGYADIVDLSSTSALGSFDNKEETGNLTVGIDLVF